MWAVFFLWIYDWIPENIWRGNLWREAIILCSFLQCFIIEKKRFWNKKDFKKMMMMLFFSLQRWQFCRLGILVFWWPSTCHWLIGGADKLGGIHLNIYFPSNKKADFLKYQIELKPKYRTISKFSWEKIWYLELQISIPVKMNPNLRDGLGLHMHLKCHRIFHKELSSNHYS